ncbi:hypothetical protein L1887_47908 [Cichorium endivia]|nr:hypothetical protein L1887_47908 [Cichorium endivia]
MSPHAISYTSNVPSVCAGQHSLDCWPASPNESQTNEDLTMCHRVAFLSGCDAADTAAGFPALFRRFCTQTRCSCEQAKHAFVTARRA